ncbi:MAG: DUF3124 domain-containing protein [Candidatus Melainabacteria bacterium]|nr:MAG: DUF3124 domain-containing protein [Candidatus Melainabacteria bacterium]
MRTKSQSAAITCCAVALLTAGCSDPSVSRKSEEPDSWQKHLKPTTIDKSKPMAMDEEVYIPIYSHIYVENEDRTVNLAATFSFRNVDPEHSLIIKSVRYYSTDGTLLKEYLKNPVLLNPLATADFIIEREDSSGGSGANFLIDWVSPTKMLEPLAEAVMVATGAPQSMAFTSRGIVIRKSGSSQSGVQIDAAQTRDPSNAVSVKPEKTEGAGKSAKTQ